MANFTSGIAELINTIPHSQERSTTIFMILMAI
jgi:hypothetical protein